MSLLVNMDIKQQDYYNYSKTDDLEGYNNNNNNSVPDYNLRKWTREEEN